MKRSFQVRRHRHTAYIANLAVAITTDLTDDRPSQPAAQDGLAVGPGLDSSVRLLAGSGSVVGRTRRRCRCRCTTTGPVCFAMSCRHFLLQIEQVIGREKKVIKASKLPYKYIIVNSPS